MANSQSHKCENEINITHKRGPYVHVIVVVEMTVVEIIVPARISSSYFDLWHFYKRLTRYPLFSLTKLKHSFFTI